MNFDQESLKQNLAGKFIGHELHYYKEIGSTNKVPTTAVWKKAHALK